MSANELNALMAAQQQTMKQYEAQPKSLEFKTASREFHRLSIELVHALIAENGAENVAFIVNHSGGKDSSKMLGYLHENFSHCQMFAVMADTGFEHVKPITAHEFAHQNVARYGLDLAVVRNPNKTYLEMVEKRGMFPSTSTRQCTSDLKRGPIETWVRRQVKAGVITAKIIINCTGIRAAESTNRLKQIPWSVNDMSFGKDGKGLTPKAALYGRTVYNWMPIFMDSLQDVLQWHWTNGVALHPVYVPEYHADGTKGGYLRRFSCRVCIFSTPADLRAIYINDREAFDAVASLEQRIGFTMKNGKSLFQIIGQEPTENEKPFGAEEEYDMPCAA